MMETTDSIETSAAAPTKKWWQFSMREIVLATVAIAAIIALMMQKPQPRKTSLMAQQFDPVTALKRIVKDENLPGKAFKIGGNGGRSNSAARSAFEISLAGVPDSDVKDILMPTLMKEIHNAITSEGLSFEFKDQAGSENEDTQEWTNVSGFSFGYKSPTIVGMVRVYTCYDKRGDPMLIITLDEN